MKQQSSRHAKSGTQGSYDRRENLSADNKASLLTTGHAQGRSSNQANKNKGADVSLSHNTGPTLTSFQ